MSKNGKHSLHNPSQMSCVANSTNLNLKRMKFSFNQQENSKMLFRLNGSSRLILNAVNLNLKLLPKNNRNVSCNVKEHALNYINLLLKRRVGNLHSSQETVLLIVCRNRLVLPKMNAVSCKWKKKLLKNVVCTKNKTKN